jgi:murein DD-endopeptidase MepM/ murein hydrolase activator NlpD
MKLNQLVEMNSLQEPYSVKLGEKIKISKNSADSVQTAQKTEIKKLEPTAENPGFVERTLDKLNHFSWPIRGQVVSKFGPKTGGLYNDGINIKAKEGADVKAAEEGTVAYVGNELKGYGNLVIIKHSGGWITAYSHLKNWTVKRGEKVAKGGKIGLVGSTGNVDSPQLYFGLRKGRDAVNPENYLK